jgi:purine-binding chemotaxis protein CheW
MESSAKGLPRSFLTYPAAPREFGRQRGARRPVLEQRAQVLDRDAAKDLQSEIELATAGVPVMTAAQVRETAATAGAGARQVLTFSLGEENYGVDILRVQEIRGWSAATKIPQLPAHVLGVLNLRGSIVPIIDLRVRFNLAHAQRTPLTVIIVLSVRSAAGRREFGLVVDGVSDVVDVSPENLKSAPDLGPGAGAEFIQGLAIAGERMLILLNVDELARGLLHPDMDQVALSGLSSVA